MMACKTQIVMATGTTTNKPEINHLRIETMVWRFQWQAQPVLQPAAGVADAEEPLPDSAEAELAAPALDVGVLAAESAPVDGAAPVAGALASEPPRKSVTYQPEPLSWKPAAVTCLAKVDAPQAGQAVKGESDIFWSTSLLCPHDWHL
jgi:hypothetical protein